jgi:hypothetical protein
MIGPGLTESPTAAAEHCPECGFEADTVDPHTAEATLRTMRGRYQTSFSQVLSQKDAAAVLRRRPDANTWSALEYAAHMRDVIALWGSALHRVLNEVRPEFFGLDPDLPDRFAAQTSYNSQDPSVVAQEFAANAERLAKKVATIAPDQWQRLAIFGEEQMTALAIVRKVAHEGHHHLLDIERCLGVSRTEIDPHRSTGQIGRPVVTFTM